MRHTVVAKGVDVRWESRWCGSCREKDTKGSMRDEGKCVRWENTTTTETFFLAGISLRKDLFEVT